MISIDIASNTASSASLLQRGSTFHKIYEAVIEYFARRERRIHPVGEFDNIGRFFISEGCACCDSLRRPTRTRLYSQMIHGRSLKHVAHKYQVSEYIRIVRRAKWVYEKVGDDACQAYLASKEIRDRVMAIDLGL
jgi:hypothetical protein